jgi:predicted ATPase
MCVNPSTAPELVPETVATVLGIRAHTSQDLIQTTASVLGGRSTLLVLDNCEHLITAGAELSDRLLHECSGLRILATSRESLRIPAETTWHVKPLPAPDSNHLPALEVMRQFPAVELFLTRAQAVRPEFQLTDSNAAAIARICEQLDGLPLALELAAARVSAVTAEQLAARLDDAFQVLTRGPRTVAARHQTLRGTLDWSYDLLLESERCVLRRTSVFARGQPRWPTASTRSAIHRLSSWSAATRRLAPHGVLPRPGSRAAGSPGI